MLRSNWDVVLEASRQNGSASTFALKELLRHRWRVLQRMVESHLAARGESFPFLVFECRTVLDLEVVLHTVHDGSDEDCMSHLTTAVRSNWRQLATPIGLQPTVPWGLLTLHVIYTSCFAALYQQTPNADKALELVQLPARTLLNTNSQSSSEFSFEVPF